MWLTTYAYTFLYTDVSYEVLGEWRDAFTGFVSTYDQLVCYTTPQGKQVSCGMNPSATFADGFNILQANFPGLGKGRPFVAAYSKEAKTLLEVCSQSICVERGLPELSNLAQMVVPDKVELWELFARVSQLRAKNAARSWKPPAVSAGDDQTEEVYETKEREEEATEDGDEATEGGDAMKDGDQMIVVYATCDLIDV